MRAFRKTRTTHRDEGGQALLIVVVMSSLLSVVVFGAQALVNAQTPTVASTDAVAYALQAAHAGVDDYITQLDMVGPQMLAPSCSQFFCGTTDPPPSTYLEFVNCPYNSVDSSCPPSTSWANTGSGSGISVQYQYMVNSKGFNATSQTPQSVTVWSTGRAGSHGRWAYQTVRATIVLDQSGPSVLYPSSVHSCSANEAQWTAPPGATYAEFTIDGGSGGSSSSESGGAGQEVIGAIAVEPGWTFTASAGFQGGWGYKELAGLLYAQGGPGGCGHMSMTGGNGGGEGVNLLSTTGGGGGGGSGLCYGIIAQCNTTNTFCATLTSSTTPGCMISVGGGGGGAGGGTTVIDVPPLLDASAAGGQGGNQSGTNPNGANGSGLSADVLGIPILQLPGGTGGAAGAQASTGNGQNGQQSYFSLIGGAGGGGGGGFNGGGGGGGDAGQPGPTTVYHLVDVASGGGGGGQGGGTSSIPPFFWSTGSCTFSDHGSHAGNGEVTIRWFGGPYCAGTPVMGVSAAVQQVTALP